MPAWQSGLLIAGGGRHADEADCQLDAADVDEFRVGVRFADCGRYLGGLPLTDAAAVANALHHASLAVGAPAILSSLSFWSLRPRDGESASRGNAETPPQ